VTLGLTLHRIIEVRLVLLLKISFWLKNGAFAAENEKKEKYSFGQKQFSKTMKKSFSVLKTKQNFGRSLH